MAFDVTPTSGEGPYTFTASFSDRLGLDLGLYITEFRGLTAVGSCPASALSGSNNQNYALALLNTGTADVPTSIPPGSCRRYVYLVRRLSDNEIVSQMSVVVDNIE